MISCTEFIPAYSELFKFIDEANGRQAVYDFWNSPFQPENSPLNHLIPKYGKLDGCWENWYVVFTEEACDNTMLQNNEKVGIWAACTIALPRVGSRSWAIWSLLRNTANIATAMRSFWVSTV